MFIPMKQKYPNNIFKESTQRQTDKWGGGGGGWRGGGVGGVQVAGSPRDL